MNRCTANPGGEDQGMKMNQIRRIVRDLYTKVIWTDDELWGFWGLNNHNEHGIVAECMEDLAANPEKARKWCAGNVKYTHYDLMQLAKYQRQLQKAESGE